MLKIFPEIYIEQIRFKMEDRRGLFILTDSHYIHFLKVNFLLI